MKKILLLISMLTCSLNNLLAQEMSKNEVFDVLTMWEGNWKNSAIFEKAVWVPESFTTRGTTKSNLILSNNYLEIMVYNDDKITKNLISYDQSSEKFNRWEFKNDGSNNFWIGEWNMNDKKMTWTFIDFSGAGISGKIIESFDSKNLIKSEVIMKDKEGQSLIIINSTKEKI